MFSFFLISFLLSFAVILLVSLAFPRSSSETKMAGTSPSSLLGGLSGYLPGRGRSRGRTEPPSISSAEPSNPSSASPRSLLPASLVDFFGSQLGDEDVINYSYTDDPWRLMAWDTYYFFYYIKYLPYVLFPYRPTDSGDLSELSPTRGNLFSILIHAILVVFQLAFLLFLPPLALILPLWTTLLIAATFMIVNKALSSLLNGPGIIFHSDPQYAAPDQPQHAHESWIFLNGVAVGAHWMTSNLNRLALTFGRPVLGIHNRTSGILFDVIECLVQRNFGYATGDVRACYPILKEKLYNPRLSRVVFLCHSQGGIEGGMILDWLLQEVPQNLLQKLEVYTFGNAANHWNNPYRTVVGQASAEGRGVAIGRDEGGAGMTTARDVGGSGFHGSGNGIVNGNGNGSTHAGGEVVREHPVHNTRPPTPDSPPQLDTSSSTAAARDPTLTTTDPPSTFTTSRPTGNSPRSSSAVRAIRHVEHYAYTTDFVALWGVLHFATARPATRVIPRFLGRLFAYTSPDGRGGHQLVQHYLDGMFPLERDPATGRFVGCRETENAFMESTVEIHGGGGEGPHGDAGRDAGKDAGAKDGCGGGEGEEKGRQREDVGRCWEASDSSSSSSSDSEFDVEEDLRRRGRRGEANRREEDNIAKKKKKRAPRDAAVEVHNGESPVALRRKLGLDTDKVKVKELSRLWKYRNGRSPPEKPPLLRRGADGLLRGATL